MSHNKPISINILTISNTGDLASRIQRLFKADRTTIRNEPQVNRVLDLFENETYDILFMTSERFQSDPNTAVEVLEVVTAKSVITQVLFLMETDDTQSAVSALKAGTYQYIKTPVADEELRMITNTALEMRPIYGTNQLLKQETRPVRYEQMIGGSRVMQEVYIQVRQAAATDIPVLITGDTGTGKDLVAQAVHHRSNRKEGPFIPVNMAALPEELVGSELFGHERGAFTGAVERHIGKFEQGNNGTVFLDEIGAINEKVQVSLLRLIEQKQFPRIGGRKAIKIDIRLIAATNADLLSLAKDGKFREDLYYRLEVFHIMLPPLKDRHGDIPLLVKDFISRYNYTFQKEIRGIDPDCLALLQSYDWPGNVRELKNLIQRTVLVCEDDVIRVSDLSPRFRNKKKFETTIQFKVGTPLDKVEYEMIIHALEAADNNRKHAAELLGISRRSLYNKLHKHHLI